MREFKKLLCIIVMLLDSYFKDCLRVCREVINISLDMAALQHTYSESLNLKHEENLFSIGFCLSQLGFDELSQVYDKFLHKEEEAHFLSLQYPKRQYSYLLGRYCAKHAISMYCKINSLAEIRIENGIFQHPVVMQAPHNNTQVSISHTEGIGAALAFPETYPMAIDIEIISLKKADIIKPLLSSSEVNLNMFETMEVHFMFLWTAKEALSKVLKCGLTVPFEMLEINSVRKVENIIVSDFKKFKQYKAISFYIKNLICSLVYPQSLNLEPQILALQKALNEKYTQLPI